MILRHNVIQSSSLSRFNPTEFVSDGDLLSHGVLAIE